MSVSICSFFAKTGECKFGQTCKWDHTEGADGGPGSSITNSLGLPVRPGQQLCAFFGKTGSCSYGATCKFDHPEEYTALSAGGAAPPMPKPRTPTPSPTGFNSQGYPTRAGAQPCTFFLKTGTCSYGISCKWDHPEGLGGSQPQGAFGKTPPMGMMPRATPY